MISFGMSESGLFPFTYFFKHSFLESERKSGEGQMGNKSLNNQRAPMLSSNVPYDVYTVSRIQTQDTMGCFQLPSTSSKTFKT